MKKKYAVMLCAVLSLLCLTACGSKTGGDDKSGGDGVDSIPSTSETESPASTNTVSTTLSPCDIDFFGTCTNSEYLSFVLYNPNGKESVIEDRYKHPETIVATVKIGQNDLWNGDFLYAYDEEDGYFNGIGGQDWFAPLNSTYDQFYQWDPGELTLYLYQPTGEERNFEQIDRPLYELQVLESPSVICPELVGDGFSFSEHPSSFASGDGWGYLELGGNVPTSASSIYLPFTEGTEGSVCYAKMILNAEIPYDDASMETAAAAGDFVADYSYTAVSDITNPDKVLTTLGDAPKLSRTVFYQDLTARYISNQYGLNLRNKDFYVSTHSDDIVFCGRDDFGLKQAYVGPYVSDNPETLKERCIDSFSYTDQSGTKFDYYFEKKRSGSNVYIYVFRNDSLTGRIACASRNGNDTAESILSFFFGIRA